MSILDSRDDIIAGIKEAIREICEDNPPLRPTIRALTTCRSDLAAHDIGLWEIGMSPERWRALLKGKACDFAGEALSKARALKDTRQAAYLREATEMLARLGYTFEDLGKRDEYRAVAGQTPPGLGGALPQTPGLN